jgi:hypothetical protein
MKPITLLGYSFGFSYAFVMWATFLVAYFNGGKVLVSINTYNEAGVEFILIPITIGIMLIGIWRSEKE